MFRGSFSSWPVIVATFAVLHVTTSAANAHCRVVTQDIPATWAQDQQCFLPAGALFVYWKNACVGYSLQKDASSQVTLEQAQAAAAWAFAAWRDAPCPQGGHPSIEGQDE